MTSTRTWPHGVVAVALFAATAVTAAPADAAPSGDGWKLPARFAGSSGVGGLATSGGCHGRVYAHDRFANVYSAPATGPMRFTRGRVVGGVGSALPLRPGQFVPIDVAGALTRPTLAYLSALSGGVYKTTDGGATWRLLPASNPERQALAIAVSRNGATIYVSSDQAPGIWRSTDAGRTWVAGGTIGLESDLGDPSVSGPLAVAPGDGRTVFAAMGTRRGSAIIRSRDGGRTWIQRNLGTAQVGSITVAPQNPNYVFAMTSEGVYRSTDGGRTWRNRGMAHMETGDVVVTRGPRWKVYAGNAFRGVWVSSNRGATWKRISPTAAGMRVAQMTLTPDGGRLLATGFTNSKKPTGIAARPLVAPRPCR